MMATKNANISLSKKAPSFEDFKPTSPIASYTKSKNRSKGTQHEILLQESLKKIKLKFEKNAQNIVGKPDIVFKKQRVVVFCDGDFWHGRNWPNLRQKLSKGKNSDYWIAKISSNIKRDLQNNLELQKQGWKVIRLWESDIKKESAVIAEKIAKVINSQSIRK